MAKSVKWAETTCLVHGKQDDHIAHTRQFPQVVCGIGKTRKERKEGGCPKCREQANK